MNDNPLIPGSAPRGPRVGTGGWIFMTLFFVPFVAIRIGIVAGFFAELLRYINPRILLIPPPGRAARWGEDVSNSSRLEVSGAASGLDFVPGVA
jgi:hypothetical protein